jgi:L-lysine 2,3-aminomutase
MREEARNLAVREQRVNEPVYFEDLDAGLAWVVEPSGRAIAISTGGEPLELSREAMELLVPGVLEMAKERGLRLAE